jgi:MoaA/NifB/PqqE/SkfB family radical SAM enzyme
MTEPVMKSESSQISKEKGQIDWEVLRSPSVNPSLFQNEERFAGLPLEEKVAQVMGFSPRIFQVETTSRCNLNCPLCSTHHLQRGYSDMTVEQIQAIVADNPLVRFMCLHLMGEPLLCSSIFSIIKYLKSRGIYTYFSTNGMMLEEKAQEILSSGLDKLSISLDGINQEELTRYRKGASLGKILRGIQVIQKAKFTHKLVHPLLQVQTLMFSYNEAKESEVVAFLEGLGVDRIKLKKPSFDSFGGENDPEKGFDRARHNATGRYSRRAPGYVKYRDRAVCRLLFQGFALSDGTVVPCCIDYDGRHAYGSLKRQTWNEIGASDQRREVLEQYFSEGLGVCKTCSLGYGYSTTVYDRVGQRG